MLGQAAGYAATALGYLATGGGSAMLVKEIADACDIPGPYLAKIVNTLRRVGLVQTQRGVGGGVTLARAAQGITLFEICQLLQDPIIEKRCMLGVSECSDERACPAHKYWTHCREEQWAFLKKMTIADIAAFETRRRTRAIKNGEQAGPMRLPPLPSTLPLGSGSGPGGAPGADALTDLRVHGTPLGYVEGLG